MRYYHHTKNLREVVDFLVAAMFRLVNESSGCSLLSQYNIYAIYMAAIKHFRPLIEGRLITVYTDHKPLGYPIKNKISKNDTLRRIRHLDVIMQFCTNLQYISGFENCIVDNRHAHRR